MDDAGRKDLVDDSRFHRILTEYRDRISGGENVDDEKFVAEHPEYADALRSWIATSSRPELPGLHSAADSLHSTGYRPMSNQETIPPEAAPARRATAEPLPEQFGRYRIVRCLGQGAMGAVYLAHDAQLDREVAIKIPKFAADDGPEFVQRFYREAQAAATLRHANVCPVYDVGEIDGTHYLSMAYLEGCSLSEMIKREPRLPESRAVEIVLKLARAVAAAHAEGVIHRDLKPANIMVDEHGEPIIMDFGLARRLNADDVRLTQAGLVVGSPAYMSPEQVEGDLDVMGVGCDIYSLGVIFYELLTGEIPFKGSIAAVMGQIITQPPRKPTAIRPGIDSRLEAICLKMMEKKIADRYATMRDVVTALSNYRSADAAVSARSASLDSTRATTGLETLRESYEQNEGRRALAEHASRFALRPWMVWTAVVVVVGGFGVTWWMVAMALEAMNQVGVSASARQVIQQRDLKLFLDGRQLPEEEFDKPIVLGVGLHKLEIRDGDTVILDDDYEVPEGELIQIKVREKNGSFSAKSEPIEAPPAPEPEEPKKTAEVDATAPAEKSAEESATKPPAAP
ncbi:MAG: serine/threonine-protein kinase [Planctomycetaceae bacterium]